MSTDAVLENSDEAKKLPIVPSSGQSEVLSISPGAFTGFLPTMKRLHWFIDCSVVIMSDFPDTTRSSHEIDSFLLATNSEKTTWYSRS